MTDTIGIGVIGMGWMGEVHSRAYRQITDRFRAEAGILPRLVICSDMVEKRAQLAQTRFGFEAYTTNWHEVIEHPDVQVVNIAAPNSLHLEMIRAAAAAGKHILCEKPVGIDPQQTALAEQAAREADVLTFVGYNYRWAPVVQYARQILQSGRIGRLTHYRGRFFTGYARNPSGVLSWRFEAENGLGTLGDLMTHSIDMAHMLIGPMAKVIGNRETFIKQRPIATPGEGTHFNVGSLEGPMGDVTNEDYVGMLIRFDNGVQGTLEACRIITGPKCEMSFEINGTKGAIKWNFERMNEIDIQFTDDDNLAEAGYTNILAGPAHPYQGHFNPGPGIGIGYEDLKVIEALEFMKSIAAGQQSDPGFGDALAVANVQAAVVRSWESEAWEPVTSLRVA